MPRPIGIDLFAGVGGLSLGFEQAGFDVVAAVEVDPVHAAVHSFNFPNCATIPRSVVGLSGDEIRRAAGIGNRKIDVVFGGAPCQGFSLIGHRAFDDPRNSLVKEFVRVVGELKPSYFVFENVKGLTVGRHKQFLEEIISAFVDLGYRIQLPWKVLNAASYGVPQSRERLVLMGAKKGAALPFYPRATTRPAGSEARLVDLPEGPSVKSALFDLPDAEHFDRLLSYESTPISKWGKMSAYAKLMRCVDSDGWYFGYRRDWEPNELTASTRTHHTPISRRRFSETLPGEVEPISRFYKLPQNGVSNTLRAGTDSARGAFTSPRPIHPERDRCITVREMARLHGFPDWFRLHATKWHGARQIGNAVPPPMARAVATAILEAAGVTPERPESVQQLGDASLLYMTLAQAAAHWSIPFSATKRDRKSGARKRSQAETERSRLSTEYESNV